MRVCNGIIVVCLGLLFAGCDSVPIPPANTPAQQAQVPPPPNGVVVVNLAVVAKALGEDALFKEQIEKANSTLTQQLTQIAGQLNKQLETEKVKLGEDIDDAGRQRLARLTQQAQSELRKKQQEARRKGQQFQTGLRQKFIEKVRPIAARIAQARNATAVSAVGSNLVWYDPKTDITQDVIAAMKAPGESSESATTESEQPAKNN